MINVRNRFSAGSFFSWIVLETVTVYLILLDNRFR